MYVCRRCQANFKTGDGKPDSRLPGLGKCNKCLAAASGFGAGRLGCGSLAPAPRAGR